MPTRTALRAPVLQDEAPLNLPNLFIAGVQKGGTTTIAGILANETQVCGPRRFPDERPAFAKEVHFFDHKLRLQKGVHFLASRYRDCHHRYVIDATPDYLRNAEEIYHFYEAHGDPSKIKIVLSLREPVSREISLYHYMVQLAKEDDAAWLRAVVDDNNKTIPFEEYYQRRLVPHLPNLFGMYHRHLLEWFKFFDRDQILILSFDELALNGTTYMQRIYDFLDLGIFQGKVPHLNAASGIDIPCRLRRKLAKAFAQPNEKLYELLENSPGPSMEERPFPRFHEEGCMDTNDS